MELFNSNGELVYTSEAKTLRVWSFGTVSFSATTAQTINIPPTLIRPQIHMSLNGFYSAVTDGMFYYLLRPCFGNFKKNASNQYDRFQAKIWVTVISLSFYNSIKGSENPTPWLIPYVVFLD